MARTAGTPIVEQASPSAEDRPLDEVDKLVDEWRRERPDLDPSPLEVLSRIARLAKHLDRHRARVFNEHGLDLGTFDVLAALRRAGAPHELAPGALLRPTLVTSGTMTNRIDRLEEAGLVDRRTDDRDRRGVVVRLTAAGLERVDVCIADLLAGEEQLLAGLHRRQRDELALLLRQLLLPFEE